MFCQHCGSQNDDNAFRCVNCGEMLRRAAAPQLSGQQIPNYMAQSILVTLFCCLPAGIPAIVYAAQVNSKLQAGDVAGAMDSSQKAKSWCWWSFGIGMAVVVLYFGIGILAALSEM